MKNYGLQLLLKMTKYFALGMLVQVLLFTLVFASESNAQKSQSVKEVFVNLGFEDVKLKDVFSRIESKTEFRFTIYESEDYLENTFTLQRKKMSVEDLLTQISRETGLVFQQINNNIGIKKGSNYELKRKPRVEIIIQTRKITGKVTAFDTDEGLPGVNVVEKGTSNGTVTDIQGNYSLEVSEGAILVFSSVGYTQEEVEVGNRSVVDLVMTQDIQQLQELVVVGYGTQKRKDVTGAISSVDAKTIESIPSNSFEQAIQGRLPGVQVTQSNPAPGGGLSIRIRGNNSITGNSEPLFVIDGVPIISNNAAATPGGVGGGGFNGANQNALATLNPGDIASIEVLKDASATAIYGSRGANGVVIITTKSGEAGKPKLNFDAYFGVQTPNKKLDLLGPEDFVTKFRESYENAELPIAETESRIEELLNTGGFDYQEDLFASPLQASIQNYQFSASGASSDGINYFVSASYFGQDGVLKETGFDRYSVRLNLDKSFGNFRFGNNITFSRTDSRILPTDGIQGIVSAVVDMHPVLPIRNENGDFYYEGLGGFEINSNPAALLRGTTNNLATNRLLGSIFAEYEFFDGLTFRSTLGADLANRSRTIYYDRTTGPRFGGTDEPGLAEQARNNSNQVVSTNTLNYQTRIADRDQLSLTGVFEAQVLEGDGFSVINRGFPSDALGADVIGSGQRAGGPAVGYGRGKSQLLSWVGRAFYSFDDRYLITATFRADGSSKFRNENKWGYFPSLALGWRLSEEAFFNGIDQIDELKLRASYGIIGNQEIPALRTVQNLRPQSGTIFGGVRIPTVAVASLGNPDLKWETTKQVNFGLTSSFFANRMNFSFDYYVKNTTDLLLSVSIPLSAGFDDRPIFNFGEVKNQGFEIALGGEIVQTADFSWTADINFSRNVNEVIKIFGENVQGGNIASDNNLPGNFVATGLPVGVFYGYKTDGIYNDQAELDNDPVTNEIYLQEVGEYKIVDISGDNIINAADRTVIGEPYPDFFYGLNTSLSYKNLSLDLFFQGIQGNEILWNDSRKLFGPWPEFNSLQARFNDRWTPQNTDAAYPKYNVSATELQGFYDDRMIFDGSYFRLRNVTLGYVLPSQTVNFLSNLRIYASATNLFTLTNYPGYNPDVNSFGQNAINSGIDLGAYPLSKTYTIGFNASF